MSETPNDEFGPGFPERLKDIIRGGAVIMTGWNNAESYPDATQRADNDAPAVSTLPDMTPAENAVSGAIQARLAPNGEYIPLGAEWSEQEQKVVPMQLVREEPVCGSNLDTVMRRCGQADDQAPATGTEALVCADIARRQRRGLAKYGKTVIGNPLTFAQWLQHFYEELLDGAVYAKRILTMNHDNQNENQSDGGADNVQPDNADPVNRHQKPGAGRKAKPCPGCGAIKSIGSTVRNSIPTRRCKSCGFVVRTYPHLANVKTPAQMA